MRGIEKYIPLVLFVGAVSKGLFLGFSWVDVLAIAVLGAISAFYEFKSNDKKIQILHERCNKVDEHLTTLYKKSTDVEGYFSGMKVAQGMRGQNVSNAR